VRTYTLFVLGLNLLVLLVVSLWLLVTGGERGYFLGGAAAEVDGVLLSFLSLANLAYLSTVLLLLPSPARVSELEAGARSAVTASGGADWHGPVRGLTKLTLALNGVLLVVEVLWLLVASGRWAYFAANALQVDMVMLLGVTVCNLTHMLATLVLFRERG
jgi:hypothetical protein